MLISKNRITGLVVGDDSECGNLVVGALLETVEDLLFTKDLLFTEDLLFTGDLLFTEDLLFTGDLLFSEDLLFTGDDEFLVVLLVVIPDCFRVRKSAPSGTLFTR